MNMLKKEKIAILVCAHKPDEHIRNYPPYKAIQVGSALLPEMDLGFLKDNVGENISEKNPMYCELSAIYWGWKNIKNVEYLGLAHYRRYFDIDINETNVDKLMKGYDMMVVKGYKTVDFSFNKRGVTYATSQEDFWLYIDTFLYMRPEYKSEIIDYFVNCNKYTPFTMFLAKKEVYDDFCEFVFPVFFELEKRIPMHPYSRQNRFMAYFGEWTLGLYIYCKHLKVKRVPYVMLGDNCNHTPVVKYSVYRLAINNLKYYLKYTKAFLRRKKAKLLFPDDIKVGLMNDGYELKGLESLYGNI